VSEVFTDLLDREFRIRVVAGGTRAVDGGSSFIRTADDHAPRSELLAVPCQSVRAEAVTK
jgi:hypothetical protein